MESQILAVKNGTETLVLPSHETAPQAHDACYTTPEFEAWRLENTFFRDPFDPSTVFNSRVTLETALADCGPVRRGEKVVIKRPGNNIDGTVDKAGLDEEAQFLKKCQMPGVVELRNYAQGQMIMLRPIKTAQGAQIFSEWMKEHPYRRTNHLDETVLDALLQIVDTTQRIHARDIVHRDLKPANILISDNSDGMQFVIADFGTACYAGNVPINKKFSAGSLSSMPPEQFTKEPTRKASDVYALGVLIYRSFTGISPHDTEELEHYAEKQEGAFPKVRLPVRELNKYVSKRLSQLVEQCLDADYTKRPALEQVYGTLHNEKAHAKQINSRGMAGYVTRAFANVA